LIGIATKSKFSSTKRAFTHIAYVLGIESGRGIDSTACQLVMPESILSYNLTRKYPYPWFTWLVVVGGITATALFTVLNLAADGYESE
jgi:hypothetical protein